MHACTHAYTLAHMSTHSHECTVTLSSGCDLKGSGCRHALTHTHTYIRTHLRIDGANSTSVGSKRVSRSLVSGRLALRTISPQPPPPPLALPEAAPLDLSGMSLTRKLISLETDSTTRRSSSVSFGAMARKRNGTDDCDSTSPTAQPATPWTQQQADHNSLKKRKRRARNFSSKQHTANKI